MAYQKYVAENEFGFQNEIGGSCYKEKSDYKWILKIAFYYPYGECLRL
jgi:hypothetical protein